MNVVAVFDGRHQAWEWRIMDEAGNPLTSSGTHYGSMAEALKAGAEHRDRIAGQRPGILRQPIRGRRARP
jgi:hypothetical protein